MACGPKGRRFESPTRTSAWIAKGSTKGSGSSPRLGLALEGKNLALVARLSQGESLYVLMCHQSLSSVPTSHELADLA